MQEKHRTRGTLSPHQAWRHLLVNYIVLSFLLIYYLNSDLNNQLTISKTYWKE